MLVGKATGVMLSPADPGPEQAPDACGAGMLNPATNQLGSHWVKKKNCNKDVDRLLDLRVRQFDLLILCGFPILRLVRIENCHQKCSMQLLYDSHILPQS